jgi:beta-glucosidase
VRSSSLADRSGAHGDTIADVLLGDVSPSGKLAETIPVRLSDTPSFLNFPGEHSHVRYSEGIYVGYRYYDARSIGVDYPFGYGLSYTTFEYSDPVVTTFDVDDPLAFTADITVTNTGSVAGAEVVQLYVSDHAPTVTTPPQELRGFTKIYLHPVDTHQERRSGHGRLYRRPDWTTRPHWAMSSSLCDRSAEE